ncbi:MAG: SpoIID/LytB domain-containing protein, partial [Jatrophihabitantaceae bacterium]
ILSFYYPGTALVVGSAVSIRVQVSGVGAYPTVLAKAGLTVSGVAGALPTTGIDFYQARPISGGFQLWRHYNGAWQAWKNIAANLTFQSSSATVAVQRGSGATTYRGAVSVFNVGGSATVVNRLSLDDYARGVVPSEMPASWQAAAVQAQAVAARSYARYFVNHPRDTNYDICDTTSCQVYGGMNAEQAASNTAVSATANRVLTYAGSTIFAEFSASNGGITSSGGQPYFVTKLDPYDNAASGDPYLNWTTTVAPAEVAAYYGLAKVSQIQITGRAPGGQWGGLVTTATVVGSYPGGAPASISTSGVSLASAMGLSYTYFKLRPVLPLGHLDQLSMTGLHTMTARGWALDLVNGGASTSVRVTVDGTSRSVLANLARPDVQAVYHSGSPNHGFNFPITVAGGTHTVCISALTLNGSDSASLGCRTVTVPVSPIGHVDSLSTDNAGHYRLQGWTFDPDDNGGPARVHVYVDAVGYSLSAALVRTDVAQHYGLGNALVGFDVTVFVPAGKHKLCAYGINRVPTAGVNQVLQCWTITR